MSCGKAHYLELTWYYSIQVNEIGIQKAGMLNKVWAAMHQVYVDLVKCSINLVLCVLKGIKRFAEFCIAALCSRFSLVNRMDQFYFEIDFNHAQHHILDQLSQTHFPPTIVLSIGISIRESKSTSNGF